MITFWRSSSDSIVAPRGLLPAIAIFSLAVTLTYLPIRAGLTVIGLTAGGVLLLRWPWLIWLVIGVALPVSSGLKMGFVSVTDGLLALALALWFVDGVRRRTVRVEGFPIIVPVALYLGALLLSLLNATQLGEAGAEVVKWLEFLIVLWIVPQMLPRMHARWLVVALLLGGVGQALLGLYQFVFRIGPEWFMILGRFMRASGSFAQPNPYAGYLGLMLPVAVSLGMAECGMRSREYGIQRLAWLLFYFSATGLMGAGLVASWSRGGWVGALVGVGAVVLLRNHRTMLVGGVAALVVVSLIVLGSVNSSLIPAPLAARVADIPTTPGMGALLNQPLTDENFAVVERLAHWVAALRMWERAPWLGVGAGNFTAAYVQVHLPLWDISLGHAHNIYLNTLAETGIVGLATYLLLWVAVLVWLVSHIWSHSPSIPSLHCPISPAWSHAFVLGVLGVILHLSVHNFFDNLFVQGIYLQVGMWLALVQLVVSHPKEKSTISVL